MKYLGVSPKKNVQDAYIKPQTLTNKIKEKLNKELSYVPGEKDNIVKTSVFLNLIYGFYAIPIKISKCYFMIIDKLILEFIWRGQSVSSVQSFSHV